MDKMKAGTKGEAVDLKAAREEARFSANDLLEELIPLIEEYYVCNIRLDKSGINLDFLNNQKFIISAVETV